MRFFAENFCCNLKNDEKYKHGPKLQVKLSAFKKTISRISMCFFAENFSRNLKNDEKYKHNPKLQIKLSVVKKTKKMVKVGCYKQLIFRIYIF